MAATIQPQQPTQVNHHHPLRLQQMGQNQIRTTRTPPQPPTWNKNPHTIQNLPLPASLPNQLLLLLQQHHHQLSLPSNPIAPPASLPGPNTWSTRDHHNNSASRAHTIHHLDAPLTPTLTLRPLRRGDIFSDEIAKRASFTRVFSRVCAGVVVVV